MKPSFLVLVLAPLAFAADLPEAAQRIVKQLETDVIAVNKRAAQQLESVKQFEMRRGNLEGANAVQAKIAELTGAPAPTLTASAPGAPTAAGANRVTIQANEKFGHDLGAVKAGQKLTLQYVEGTWSMSHQSDPKKWVSPDVEQNSANNLGIYAVVDGEATLLAGVPAGTKRRAFRYRFEKDHPRVILRIQDKVASDNPGAATYEVTLAP